MKKTNFLSLIFAFLLLPFAFASAPAQETTPTPAPNQVVRPFKIMQELGLNREQIRQIRRINQERRPLMQAAQQRWRAANRTLDAAVYADSANDDEIRELTKQAQFAQGELLRERTETEYLIRKVLTPDQLVRFRQLREQLMQKVKEFKVQTAPNNPNEPRPRALNRLQQRRNQNRPQ